MNPANLTHRFIKRKAKRSDEQKKFTPSREAERSDEEKKFHTLEERPSAAMREKKIRLDRRSLSHHRFGSGGQARAYEFSNHRFKTEIKITFQIRGRAKKSFRMKPEN